MSKLLNCMMVICILATVAVKSRKISTYPVCDDKKNELLCTSYPCDAMCSDPMNYKTCSSTEDLFSAECRCLVGQFRNDDGVCVNLTQCPIRYSKHGWSKCEQEKIKSAYPLLSYQPAPDCDEYGNYATKQCIDIFGLACYCVNPLTGEIDRSTIRNSRDLEC